MTRGYNKKLAEQEAAAAEQQDELDAGLDMTVSAAPAAVAPEDVRPSGAVPLIKAQHGRNPAVDTTARVETKAQEAIPNPMTGEERQAARHGERPASNEQNAFNNAASDFQNKFLAGLNLSGVETASLWANQKSDGMVGSSIQTIIASRSPEELMDAMIAATDDPQQKEVLSMIKDDAALSERIHFAAANDETVLEGMKKIALNDEAGFNMDDLETMLADPRSREMFGNVMVAVGENPDVDFEDAIDLADKLKRKDYEAAMKSLNKMGVEAPAELALAGELSGFQSMIQSFMQTGFGQMLMGFLDKIGMGGFVRDFAGKMGIEVDVAQEMADKGASATQTGKGLEAAPQELAQNFFKEVTGMGEKAMELVTTAPQIPAPAAPVHAM